MEVAAGSNKHPGKSENMMSATQHNALEKSGT